MNKTYYSGIDITKFICAIMVVAIHTQPFINFSWLDRGPGIVTRLAVPFFFVCTGFFLFDDIVDSPKIKKYLLRILLLYVIWSIVYLPFNWPIDDLIRTFLIEGVSGHLWYLPALLFSIVLILILDRIISVKAILLLSSIVYLLGVFLSTYKSISSLFIGERVFEIIEFIGTRNGLFYGFFYVSLGMWISKNTKRCYSRVHHLVMLMIGLVLLGIEGIVAVIILHTSSTILWITCPLPVYALFMLTKGVHVEMNTLVIKKMSSFIYFSHYLWIDLLSMIGVIDKGIKSFLYVVVISSIVAYLFIKLSAKSKVLRYTY